MHTTHNEIILFKFNGGTGNSLQNFMVMVATKKWKLEKTLIKAFLTKIFTSVMSNVVAVR